MNGSDKLKSHHTNFCKIPSNNSNNNVKRTTDTPVMILSQRRNRVVECGEESMDVDDDGHNRHNRQTGEQRAHEKTRR